MHVPEIHNLNHLLQNQNPLSFLSQIQPLPIAYNLCTWASLILALFTAFYTITKSLNILLIRYQHHTHSIPNLTHVDDNDYSDTDDEDETASSVSSSSSDFEDEEDGDRNGEHFRLRGSVSIGDLFSLAEIANSKSVVKLWDTIGLGLGFGFDHSGSSDVVSVYDPSVVVSAGESALGNLALRVWDTRLRRRVPALIAEWGPTVESDGVHVRDDGRYGLTVGDMRNVLSPLENVTEGNVDTWWPNSFLLKI